MSEPKLQNGIKDHKRVLIYGTFDLFHDGHRRLLERARSLGTYLIVGVTSDAYDLTRGKLNVQEPLFERMRSVERTGIVDEIIVEEYEGQKVHDIQKHQVDVFTVGSDWVGWFDYLNVTAKSDAIYIASPHDSHAFYIREALEHNKHVLCEKPLCLSEGEAEELFALASEKRLVLFEGIKTAYLPAWKKLIAMTHSGIIGDIVSVSARCTMLQSRDGREYDKNKAGGSINELGSYPMLAIAEILGMKPTSISCHSIIDKELGIDTWSQIDVVYPAAHGTCTVAIGAKAEGDLVATGTKGYIYVPAPWWLTSSYQFRFEDQTKNQEFVMPFQGDAIRYGLAEFGNMVRNGETRNLSLPSEESCFISKCLEEAHKRGRQLQQSVNAFADCNGCKII